MSRQYRGPGLAWPESGDTDALASDGDRDAAARLLNEAFAEGRLTADEHGERVRGVYAARTWHELARLTADLPGPAQGADPAASGMADGLDRCLLCALLICCPPAGIAWLLAAWHRARGGQRHPVTAARLPPAGRGGATIRAGWHAEDR